MNNNIFKTIKAFTLAEILITLGIIGIVAAITIPTLVKNIDDQANRNALKKAFSILSEVTTRVKTENNGTILGVCSTSTDCKNAFKAYLSFTKDCDASGVMGKCWGSSWKTTDNNAGWNLDSVTNSAGLVLNDGMYMTFESVSATCARTDGNNPASCFAMSVDVNGNKAPNKMGYDIFRFYVYTDRAVPFGTSAQIDNLNNYPCSKSGRGDCCTAAILQNSNFVIPDS